MTAVEGSVTVSGDWLKHLSVPGNENDATSVLRSVLFQNFTQHRMVVLY